MFSLRVETLLRLPCPTSKSAIGFLQKIVSSRVSGVGTVQFQNGTRLVAYQPIFVNSSNQTKVYIGALLVGYDDVVPAMQAAQISSLGTFTGLTIVGIGAGTVLACLVFLRWNRRLESTVELRTAELRESNDELKMRNIAQLDFIDTAANESSSSVRPLQGIIELMRRAMGESMNVTGAKRKIEILGERAESDGKQNQAPN